MKGVIVFLVFCIIIFLAACSSEEAITSCVSKYDCPEGYVCEAFACVPEVTDNSTAGNDTTTGKDVVSTADEEDPVDEAAASENDMPEGLSDSSSDGSDAGADEKAEGVPETDLPLSDSDSVVTDDAPVADGDAAENDTAVPDIDINIALCGNSKVDPGETCDSALTTACNAIPDKGYNNAAQVSCKAGCTSGWDTAACTCASGYAKDGSAVCKDVNECTAGTAGCNANATCANTAGSFTCTCNNYYTGSGTECTFCNNDTQCGTLCIACSGNTTHCKDNGNNTSTCVQCTEKSHCSTGFDCVNNTCTDINECATNNGGCAQVCTNSPAGSFTCSCNAGYTLNADGHSCDNIDECVNNYGGCRTGGDANATCSDTTPGYTCNCSSGFTFSGGTCTDINECTNGTHNCNANAACANTAGSFTCACKAYYSGDGVNCTYCNTDLQCGATCGACSGTNDHCKDYGNGTSACVDCTDNSHCASGYVCNSSNQCVVPIPAEACTTGSQSRDGCSNARIVGRKTAKGSSGYVISADTCYANDKINQPSGSGICYDAGSDHTYKIYLRAGETAAMTLSTSFPCGDGSSWDATLSVYNNTACGLANQAWCDDYFSGTKSYTAPADGWYIIVVEGSTAFDDEGDYTLTVKLQNCINADCNCP